MGNRGDRRYPCPWAALTPLKARHQGAGAGSQSRSCIIRKMRTLVAERSGRTSCLNFLVCEVETVSLRNNFQENGEEPSILLRWSTQAPEPVANRSNPLQEVRTWRN
jgi:hypothetical protein